MVVPWSQTREYVNAGPVGYRPECGLGFNTSSNDFYAWHHCSVRIRDDTTHSGGITLRLRKNYGKRKHENKKGRKRQTKNAQFFLLYPLWETRTPFLPTAVSV